MLVIDEKGRLFGKINLFDFIIILIICIFLGYGISKIAQRYLIKKEYDQYVIQLKALNLEEQVANSIKKGDVIVSPTGSKFGEIITAPQIKPTEVYVTTPEGLLISRTQPKLKDVYFTILVSVPKGANTINYGNQTFKVGASGIIETNLGKYAISILSIEKHSKEAEIQPKSP